MAYNTIKLPSSSAPSMSQVRIETFLGVDLTNQASNVDEYKSPNAENMIRDVPGKVRKCMGWYIYEDFEGWMCDTSKCRRWEELPAKAQSYILEIEKRLGVHITYISVGPERDQLIVR